MHSRRARVPYYICLFVVLALASAYSLHGSEYLFSTISLNEGLSQTTARSMLRDSHGLVWIGTKSGLNRYDAGKIKCYYSNPADDNTLVDNDIHALFEDSLGRVWVISEKGSAIYDRRYDRFIRLECKGKPVRVRSYLPQDDGILLGGGGQLMRYDYATNSVTTVPTSGGSNRYYTSICEWYPDHFILSTRWDGMWVYNSKTGRIDRIGFTDARNIMATYVDGDGSVWVSPYGEGLLCYDRSGRVLASFDASTLGSAIVLDIMGDGDRLWVATDGGGIHTIDLMNLQATPIQLNTDSRQKGLRSVIRLYRDNLGYIYAGTVRDGVTCITSSPMRTFAANTDGAHAITSLLADDRDIWIGEDGGGIVLYRPDDGDSFTAIDATDGLKVTSLEHYDANNIIVSTFDSGIFLFDKRTRRLSHAPAMFAEIAAANSKKALALDLRRLPGNRMAVLSDRIYIVDLNRRSWEDVPSTRVNNRLNEIYTDYRRMLCYTDGEIISFDIDTEKVETLASVPDRSIACATYDGAHTVYIGTAGGILQLDTDSHALKPLDSPAPMPQRVTSLIYDKGRMWIAAGGTVYVKNFNNGDFCRFDRYDGVAPNEFINKANLATPTKMYMGGTKGLLKVDRGEITDFISRKQTSQPVHATDVDADGSMLASMGPEDLYEVPYDHSTVTLRVDGGDTHPFRQSPFRFYINSPDGDSPIETSDNTFTINRLPAGGRFDIYAQAVAPDGTWSAPRRVATFQVNRPWWSTGWARAGYIIAVALLIAAALAVFLRRRKALAERKLAEFEKQSLEKEVGFLTDMNHELRTPLTLIYARLRGLMESMHSGTPLRQPEVEDELSNIYQNTRRMRDIINTTVDQWVVPPEIAENARPEGDVEKKSHHRDTRPIDTSSMTVLIAEGDSELSDYLASNLRKCFGRVIVANDGSKALAEVKNVNPDLIITDAKLPGMSGAELCGHIKQLDEFGHIPIIMLTTRVEDMSLRGGHDLGADIYITKPFDMNQLMNRCRMVLRSFDRVKQRYIRRASDILPRDNYNNDSESFLLKIKDVIEKNIGHPGFCVDIVVEKMLMSRSSLYNKFRELTGQSLGTYIEEYRFARAKEMLAGTDMIMSEISDALGFSTQRYFSTFFRRKAGISPSQYRIDNQKPDTEGKEE